MQAYLNETAKDQSDYRSLPSSAPAVLSNNRLYTDKNENVEMSTRQIKQIFKSTLNQRTWLEKNDGLASPAPCNNSKFINIKFTQMKKLNVGLCMN